MFAQTFFDLEVSHNIGSIEGRCSFASYLPQIIESALILIIYDRLYANPKSRLNRSNKLLDVGGLIILRGRPRFSDNWRPEHECLAVSAEVLSDVLDISAEFSGKPFNVVRARFFGVDVLQPAKVRCDLTRVDVPAVYIKAEYVNFSLVLSFDAVLYEGAILLMAKPLPTNFFANIHGIPLLPQHSPDLEPCGLGVFGSRDFPAFFWLYAQDFDQSAQSRHRKRLVADGR